MSFDPIKNSLGNADLLKSKTFERFGIYDAVVEYNADPMQLGRVIVRVPLIHKDEYGVDMLPWARPCSPFGGGPGYGSYMIPPVGSRIWVMFESGDESWPVWLGTWVSNPVKDRQMLRDTHGDYPKGPVAMAPIPPVPWTAPAAPGLPKEAQLLISHRPEIYVPFKSPKGAAIVIDDRDGYERLSIYDRLGQTILFDGPCSVGANYNNNSARGTLGSDSGTGVSIERTTNREGRILIADVGGQSIELSSKQNAADVALTMPTFNNWSGTVRISSRQPAQPLPTGPVPVAETKGGPPETMGKNAAVLELSGSDNKVTLEVSDATGAITTSIHIDAQTGQITIETPNNISLKADHIKLDGDVSITGNLQATDIQVENNVIVSGSILN